MTKDFFFCVCEECSSIFWIEYVKDEKGKVNGRINHLTKEGLQQFPWKIDIHLYDSFSKMNPIQKKFQRRWISYDYEDLICNDCENRLHPIPFGDIDKKQRISIFNMNSEDRIDFANSYKIVKVLEKEND